MSPADQFQRNNDAFLAAAVEWLRLRLAQAAGSEPVARTDAPRRRGLLARIFGWDESPAATPEPAPRATPPSAKEVDNARAAMEQAARSDPPPAAILLRDRCGMSPFELDILLLCAAMELDTRTAGLCARVQGDPARCYPTFALALALFSDPAWDALSSDRPLRYWRLIDVVQTATAPLTASPLRADERIVNFLKGLNQLDQRIAAILTPLKTQGTALAPSHSATVTALLSTLKSPAAPARVHLLGSDSASKKEVAVHLAAALKLVPYELSAAALPPNPADVDALARAWQRENLLLPLALYLDARDADRDAPAVTRFLSRCEGLTLVDTREVWNAGQYEALPVDIEPPTRHEQFEYWQSLLNEPATAAQLASQFRLSLPQIRRAALSVGVAGGGEMLPAVESRACLWNACRALSRPRLDVLAQRLEVKAGWDDLVLPPAETASLREIAVHARRKVEVYDEWGFGERMNRGMGVSALFAGESGTGKTMAAEVIAKELELNLYRIDLSAVVSKYIGETEKNLRQVFDAAEDGGTILFFDEADALFGKRSEVKDSHDRYANIEINYLLQRMEAYTGLAILATNLKTSLDHAFLRRLRFVIPFPFPGQAERRKMWERAFPAGVPRRDLDFDFLSRLNVAGGVIHNIAIRAAFLASGRGVPLSMELALEACRAEFRKLDRPINEADFRWQPKRVGAVA